MACQVSPESRVSVLKDLITVYSGSGKCIIFTETKRECDAVCAAIAAVHPCEVRLRCIKFGVWDNNDHILIINFCVLCLVLPVVSKRCIAS